MDVASQRMPCGHKTCAPSQRILPCAGACAAPAPPRKRRAFNPNLHPFGHESSLKRVCVVRALICGAARPTPPATWDVASQIAPHGAGKSNRKRKRSNAFSSATPVFLFKIASALRGAHRGSGPATAGVWGRHQPPHPNTSAPISKRNRCCFIKNLR